MGTYMQKRESLPQDSDDKTILRSVRLASAPQNHDEMDVDNEIFDVPSRPPPSANRVQARESTIRGRYYLNEQ
eukprot:459623-Hanusia_phi.AAC.1